MGTIIDCSSNNSSPETWNLTQAKANGLLGVIVKATQGTDYTNPDYAATVRVCVAAGVPVIAYHFAAFGDAAAEAAYFVSVAGDRARVLDSETNTDAAWQNAFLAALNLSAAQELDYGSASTLPRGTIRCPLWPAAYGRADPGLPDEEIWQYTDYLSIPGLPGIFDGSIWKGTQEQLNVLFGVTAPTPIPQLPEDAMLVSPPFTWNGQRHFFFIQGTVLWHVWEATPGKWSYECMNTIGKLGLQGITGVSGNWEPVPNLAKDAPVGSTVPRAQIEGQLQITATGPQVGVFFAQGLGEGTWGVNVMTPKA